MISTLPDLRKVIALTPKVLAVMSRSNLKVSASHKENSPLSVPRMSRRASGSKALNQVSSELLQATSIKCLPHDDRRLLYPVEAVDQEVSTDTIGWVNTARLRDRHEPKVVEVRLEHRLVAKRGVAAEPRPLVDVVVEGVEAGEMPPHRRPVLVLVHACRG